MIKTVNLQKIFKTEEVETWALNNVNLEIKAGELAALSQGNSTTFTGECTFTDEAETPDFSQFHAIAPMAPKYSTR